ncbi:MAG: PQQ-binding-like beta-propeller repeat protein, partial [Micromonosporaceae bacterium]
MAKGAAGRFQTFLGFIGLVALGVTASIVTGVNPMEYVEDAASTALERIQGNLATPDPEWSERVDGPAVAATVTTSHVVVVLNGAVEVRERSDGSPAWYRMVDWATPAGEVVVAGRSSGGGFEVLDSASGDVRWADSNASDVWPYQDMVLSTTCRSDGSGCVMRARSTEDGAEQWRLKLSGAPQRLAGHVEFDLAVERAGLLRPDYPGAAPRLLGAVIDGQVTVVDTRSGNVSGTLPEDRNTRVTVVGDRVLGVTARPTANGGCRHTVRAWMPSGVEAWRRSGYDFGTVSGSGCEPRADPLSAGGVVAAVGPKGRPVLIRARDGHPLWTGERRERVLATDGQVAISRAPDGRQLVVNSAETGAELWRRAASSDVEVMLTDTAVLIKNSSSGTITALASDTGSLLQRWESQAAVVGADDAGVVLRNGRT